MSIGPHSMDAGDHPKGVFPLEVRAWLGKATIGTAEGTQVLTQRPKVHRGNAATKVVQRTFNAEVAEVFAEERGEILLRSYSS